MPKIDAKTSDKILKRSTRINHYISSLSPKELHHFKRGNFKVVAISGYFNPLHKGHIEYINEAKKLGHWLVVIVNNDKQRELKGSKPFQDEEERMFIMRNIKGVDEVFLSIDKDASVSESLREAMPDIFANGGDRHNEEIPESKACKEMNIKIVDGLGDKIQSSSDLLKDT